MSEANTADLTQNWQSRIPLFVALIESREASGREFAVRELNRMAQIIDQYIGGKK